ncbi:hypothetical protein [Lysobacter tyrosinilyticus]
MMRGLVLWLLFFATMPLAMAGDLLPGRAPSSDPPGSHGMLVVGTDVVYLSHLPMFHVPHNYQLIFEATLDAKVLADYRRDSAAHADTYYTLVPTGRWVLPNTIVEGASFRADLYRGHFERGGTPIRQGIAVKVRRIVHFRRFDPGHAPDPTQWIAFGRGREHFLAHRIEAAPDMDQVVQLASPPVEGQAVRLSLQGESKAGELKVGDAVPSGAVQRVIYTEYGDLAQ